MDALFVSCTRGRKEDTELFRSLAPLGTRVDRLFFENNTEGLSARYNWVLDHAGRQETLIAFVHDDVRIDDADAADKLIAGFEKGAVLGLAGSRHFTTITDPPTRPYVHWMQQPSSNWTGSVRHEMPDGRSNHPVYGPSLRPCIVMDGLFLAVDPKRLNGARFDPQFAFHFYDLDFCLTAHKAGCALSTVPIAVTHFIGKGSGYGSPDFLAAEQAFVAKWGLGAFTVT